MKRIGLVTLHSGNYGSVLQCYSLQRTVESLGYPCDVLEVSLEGSESYVNKMHTAFSLVRNSVEHPSYFKRFIAKRKSSSLSLSSLDKKAKESLFLFEKTQIRPKRCSLKQISQIGCSDDYAGFITGSDQVWNGMSPYQPFYFLEFVKKSKRIAYAPSFGGLYVAPYNRGYFRKHIKSFSSVSVRENSGVDIVRELTGQSVQRVPDPTILITNEQWKQFAKCEEKENYILLHFLDTPNQKAIQILNELCEKLKIKVIVFAYPHPELDRIDSKFVCGTPEEYVGYIQNADYVLTDSFHTTLFSIRFGKQVYVFNRQYHGGHDQSERIRSLLCNTGYENRMISEEVSNNKELDTSIHDVSEWLEKERSCGLSYLIDSIGGTQALCELKNEKTCVGCGVCQVVCPKGAISLKDTSMGYSIPSVDQSKCVGCNKCAKTCMLTYTKKNLITTEAFVAYNPDEKYRNRSASGGVFSGIACAFLAGGGVVFGAELSFNKGKAQVMHIEVDSEDQLERILGSKYVQSNCCNVFPKIKTLLNQGRRVMFCGTSCQVDSLYKYLGGDHDHLVTVDLICHGVPGYGLFNEYISFLERKNNSLIEGYSFRTKKDGRIQYNELVRDSAGNEITNEYKDSLFCHMFLNRMTYREQCYNCSFATIKKPADITLGDYFEAAKDFPELIENELRGIEYFSCMLINSTKGKNVLKEFPDAIVGFAVETEKVQLSHEQLYAPSKKPNFREVLMHEYSIGGFEQLEKYLNRREQLMRIPKSILNLVKKR